MQNSVWPCLYKIKQNVEVYVEERKEQNIQSSTKISIDIILTHVKCTPKTIPKFLIYCVQNL